MTIDKQQTGTPVAERRHEVHQFTGRVHEVLDGLLGADGAAFVALSDLSVAATREAIVELERLQARISALRGKLLDHHDIVEEHTAPWHAETTRTPLRESKQHLKIAKRSEDAFPATARALAAGRISAEHAVVIIDAVDALPGFVLETERRRAETHLLAEAQRFDPVVLRRLGTHLLEVLDPDGLEAHLAKKLEQDQAAAARATYFTMRDNGHGTVHGKFAIPALTAAILQTALDAIASPKRPDAINRDTHCDGPEAPRRPTAEVLGQAFAEYVERFPIDALPGGVNATVVVTIDLDTLLGGLRTATVDTGIRISAGEARRLASQCGVIPAVLGADSVPLDLGRAVRLHTNAQRVALRSRHATCTVEGCFVPSAWCHAHHKTPWANGGGTSVRDGTLLCPAHHRQVHRPGSTVTYDGGHTTITTTRRRT